MKHGLRGLCGAGALMLPLSVWAAPEVRHLSAEPSNLYQQTQARESTASGNLRILNQLQEHERQIQELRGQLEELRYQLDQQRQLSQEQYLDLEQRLSAEGGQQSPAAAGQPGSEVNADAANAATGNRQDGQQAYQAAFRKVQARDFEAAIEAFEAFVDNYPNSPLRANGYYWLGELYSSRSKIEPAEQAFNMVIENHPQSNKVPDALYKLGLLKARQGQPDASKKLLTRVREEYPDSNAASMAEDFLNQSGL